MRTRLHRLSLVLTGALVFSASGGGAFAQEPTSPVAQLRVLVPQVVGRSAWGTGALTNELRRVMGASVARVTTETELRAAQRKLKIAGKDLLSPEALAAAGRETGAHYVLFTQITKEGWLYTARAVLVNTATGEIQMDFRSGYYKPDAEARDRGVRIATRAVQKLEELGRRGELATQRVPGQEPEVAQRAPEASPAESAPAAGEPAQPGSEGGTATSTATAQAGAPKEELAEFGGGGDEFSAFDDASDPFSGDGGDADFAAFGDTEQSEFDGFESEGGWLWSVRGWIGTSYYAFLHSDLDESKDRSFHKLSTRITLNGDLGNAVRIRVLPLTELDTLNQRLHRVLLEEGFLEWSSSWLEVRLGWDALTWGSATTVKIVDVINARDLTEGVIDAPKIGQPMLALRFPFGNHLLSLLYLTPFVEPNLPRVDTPFFPFSFDNMPGIPPGTPLPDLSSRVVLGTELEEWHPQAAARVAFSFPSIDLRASYFYGYQKIPMVDMETFSLLYPVMHHASTDGQLLLEGTAVKWEFASIWTPETERTRNPGTFNPITMTPRGPIDLPDQRFAWILGIEHTFEELLWDTTFTPIAEYIGDSDSVWFTDMPPPDALTRFTQNHLVFGFDWSFKNYSASTIRIADIWDLANPGDHIITGEYEQRLFDNFTLELGGRWVLAEAGGRAEPLKQLSGVSAALRLNY